MSTRSLGIKYLCDAPGCGGTATVHTPEKAYPLVPPRWIRITYNPPGSEGGSQRYLDFCSKACEQRYLDLAPAAS